MSGTEQGMADYAQPGSPAWLADEAMLADLAARGVRPAGLASRILAIEAVSEVAVGVELQVVDLRSGYDLLEESTGDLVGRVEPAGATRWTITLAPREPATDMGEALSMQEGDPGQVGGSTDGGRTEQGGEPRVSPTPGDPDPGWRVVSVEGA